MIASSVGAWLEKQRNFPNTDYVDGISMLTFELSLSSPEFERRIFFLSHPDNVKDVTGPTCSVGPHTKNRLVVASGSTLPVQRWREGLPISVLTILRGVRINTHLRYL